MYKKNNIHTNNVVIKEFNNKKPETLKTCERITSKYIKGVVSFHRKQNMSSMHSLPAIAFHLNTPLIQNVLFQISICYTLFFLHKIKNHSIHYFVTGCKRPLFIHKCNSSLLSSRFLILYDIVGFFILSSTIYAS